MEPRQRYLLAPRAALSSFMYGLAPQVCMIREDYLRQARTPTPLHSEALRVLFRSPRPLLGTLPTSTSLDTRLGYFWRHKHQQTIGNRTSYYALLLISPESRI